ncbi:MAG: hypothetical protein AMXMBFR33_41600 [Candidatus Xenobia bacterium]|jgi:hypothetical protein
MKQLSGWQQQSLPPAAETGFLFEPQTGHTYVLNDSGRFLYDGIRNGTPPDLLTLQFAQHFGLAPEVAAVDVGYFLDNLERLGLGGAPCT